MNNEDDILETALNSGISFSAQKYGVSEQSVYEIVKKFKSELEDDYPCSCEKASTNGNVIMCFSCDKYTGRIKI